MVARFNPGDSTAKTASTGSGTAMFSENTVAHSASNGHSSEPAKQTDTNGKFKTATSTLDTKINPSTLSSETYPGIADTKVSSSGLIARLNRTAACSMIRFKDIIDKGTFAAGERFKMKAWIYLADAYSRGEYETLNEGSSITDKSAQKDSTAKTAKVRMFLADTETAPIANDKSTSVNLKLDAWQRVAFTYTASADDISATQGVIIDAAGETDFATQDIRIITDSFDASIVNADSELKFFLWDGFDRLKPFESAKTLTFK